MKPFVKYVNLNHMMPTRYSVTGEIDFKGIVSDDKMVQADKRAEMKKALKLAL
jgi:large subunit ribosomal protein L27e